MTSLPGFVDPSYKTVDYRTGIELRAARYRFLRRAVPWMPNLPGVRGRVNDYLWNYLPWGLAASDVSDFEGWARRAGDVYLVFEHAAMPALQASGRDLLPKVLEGEDIYIFAGDSPTEMWIFDHEGYGPWHLVLGQRLRMTNQQRTFYRAQEAKNASIRTADEASNYLERNAIAGKALDVRSSASVRLSVRHLLKRKGIAFPTGRLERGPVAWDHLWNYLPKALEFRPAGGDPYRFLLNTTDTVALLFEGSRAPCCGISTKDFHPESLTPEDVYLLDWPQKRWLIAIPKEFMIGGNESLVQPSVVLAC